MGTRTEYLTGHWLTQRQILELQDFNFDVKRSLQGKNNESGLASALSTCTSILSVVAVGTVATASGIASLIFAAIGALSSLEKDAIISTLENGESDLYDIRKKMEDENYDAVQVLIGWLEFVDEGYRTVQGATALSYYPT